MIRPPKHAAGCRGAEDLVLGNGAACRACEWFAEVERLAQATEDLMPFMGFGTPISAGGLIPSGDVARVRQALAALERLSS